MTKTEPEQFKFKIILISLLVVVLIAVSISAYIFKDKIFDQKSSATNTQEQSQKNLTQNNPVSDNLKNDLSTQANLALPFFAVMGSGYDPKVMSTFESDMSPDKTYPQSIEIAKIYDQNNKELSSPKLKKGDKIVQDGDNFYIINDSDNKKVELWNPKTNTFKTLEMPFEFDTFSFTASKGKIYTSELNYAVEDSVSFPKCGEFSDELGKCSVYEIDPLTLKSEILVGGVRSQMFGGILDKFLSRDDDFIWLEGLTGDGGIGLQYFKKYDAKTKALIYTVKIENQFSDQILYLTQAGKKEQEIIKIKCFDENATDPSLSTCNSKQYSDFDNQVYKLVPKEFYTSQDPALAKNSKIKCGKYEIADAPKDPLEPNLETGAQVLYEGKSVLDYTQLYITESICIN